MKCGLCYERERERERGYVYSRVRDRARSFKNGGRLVVPVRWYSVVSKIVHGMRMRKNVVRAIMSRTLIWGGGLGSCAAIFLYGGFGIFLLGTSL